MADTSIVEKIKKLLALSTSNNEHEAALAASRAQELMIKYAVEEADLGGTTAPAEPVGTECVRLDYKRIPTWQALLAYVMAPSFFCRSFYTRGHGIWFVGRASDRAALIATFNFLKNEIERLAEKEWATKPADFYVHGKAWKNGFYQGCCQTVQTRLAETKKQIVADNAGTAIVLANRDKDVQDYMDDQHKNLKKGSARRVNSDGFHSGTQAGWSLNLGKRASKQIGGNNG